MNKEFEFLKIISEKLSDNHYLGNDCAYLDEYKIALSKDILVEDIHFKTEYMTPFEIAQKSFLVNISDILASGSIPKYALIALSGKLNEDFISDFYFGINETAKEYDIKVIGGDLSAGDKITVSITILGDYKNKNISSRYNAKKDYIIAAKGEFGSSIKGFYDLIQGKDENYFTKFHKKPVLYPDLSKKIAKLTEFPYAMMDSSDGLIDCIYQISEKSNVKALIEYDKIPKKTENKEYVLYGGEDYSLVVFLDERDFNKFPDLVKIGRCEEGKGIYLDNDKIKYRGFKHFE